MAIFKDSPNIITTVFHYIVIHSLVYTAASTYRPTDRRLISTYNYIINHLLNVYILLQDLRVKCCQVFILIFISYAQNQFNKVGNVQNVNYQISL